MGRAGATRGATTVVLVSYLAVLLFALLNPSSGPASTSVAWLEAVGRSVGVAEAFLAPGRPEFVANVLILVPAAALASLVWSAPSWRDWTAYGFLFSLVIELLQGVLLDGRSATFVDVVANTLGALAGAVLVAGGRTLATGRSRSVDAPSIK